MAESANGRLRRTSSSTLTTSSSALAESSPYTAMRRLRNSPVNSSWREPNAVHSVLQGSRPMDEPRLLWKAWKGDTSRKEVRSREQVRNRIRNRTRKGGHLHEGMPIALMGSFFIQMPPCNKRLPSVRSLARRRCICTDCWYTRHRASCIARLAYTHA